MEIIHPVLGAFSIVKKTGSGSFATVYYARHKQLQYPVAIKIFHNQSDEEDICKALTITKNISHPFICKDFDFFKTPSGENCILMEYVKGITLLEYANFNSPLSEQEIHSIFGQLVIAIDFLHNKQIIHRDLKCENVIIDKNKNIRLIDLNFSCPNGILHSTFCGSPGYVAPEIIKSQNYGISVDIWSLGVILYAITYGNLPFENTNISMLFNTIISEEPPFPHDSRISPNLVDLIKKMLIKNPNDRISIESIKKHPFFTTDSNDKNFIFNQQKINYYIRDPLAKVTPEKSIIQQMNLSMDDSLKAVSEIKSGKITYYSMTYNILFKNFISNVQIKNYSKSFLSPSSIKYKSENIDNANNNKKIEFQQPQVEKNRTLSRSNSDDLMSSKDHFNIETENNNKIELKLFLNHNVNFRFNSVAKPLVGIGIRKRSTANLKNVKLVPHFPQMKRATRDNCASSANALPMLKSNLKK